MTLLYFDSNPDTLHESKLLAQIRQVFPDIGIIVFTDLKQLTKWLQIPPRNFYAAIILSDNPKILAALLAYRDFFTDRKLIITVTGGEKKTMDVAQQLNPNFIQWVEEDYTPLMAVLENWFSKEKSAFQWIDGYTH